MTKTNQLLGKRIRVLRKQRNLSQEQLAEKVGMSSKYLGEIERGQVNFTVDIAERISEALDIELTELFDFQHELDRKSLLKKVNSLIHNASDDELQLIFRLVKTVVR